MSELHFHSLRGEGIAEDKRMINAKSPWTLAHMDMKILQSFYNNPSVPPSMKTKLKGAMMMKPGLKKKLKGGAIASDAELRVMADEDILQIALNDAEANWMIARRNHLLNPARFPDPGAPPPPPPRPPTSDEVRKLSGGLSGGLAGVSKASGFIQRLMAENKKKHSGQYRNPTTPAHPDSTMKKWAVFDYKKIANKEQGGLSEANNSAYGASPFIQKYFRMKRVAIPFKSGNTAKETPAQKEARGAMVGRRMARVAKRLAQEKPKTVEEASKIVAEELAKPDAPETLAETATRPNPEEVAEELREHFGNVMGEPPEGIEVSAKPEEEKVAETPTPATPKRRIILKSKKQPAPTPEPPKDEVVAPEPTPEPEETPILSGGVLENKIWSPFVGFWMRWLKSYYRKGAFYDKDRCEPFNQSTYQHLGMWRDFAQTAFPADNGSDAKTATQRSQDGKYKKKEMYKEFLEKFLGYKEDDIAEYNLRDDPNWRFYGLNDVSEAEKIRREDALEAKKNTMGFAFFFWMLGKLKKEHGATIVEEEVKDMGKRLVLTNKKGISWEITSCLFDRLYYDMPSYQGGNFRGGVSVKKEGDMWVKRFPRIVSASDYDEPEEDRNLVVYIKSVFGVKKEKELLQGSVVSAIEMNEFYEKEVYPLAGELDVNIDETPFFELEVEDGVDRDAMKVIREYVERVGKERIAREKAKEQGEKAPNARSGQSGEAREAMIKSILMKNTKATIAQIGKELLEKGDGGKGGKPLAPSTLSPIVAKVKTSLNI